jgi:heterodisulfide reductase subunit A-like polyferredoxin
MQAIDKETAFAEVIRDYENLWVAIVEKDGVEFVMGHGQTAVEAAKEASEKGYPQAMLFKVPSFKSRFVY